jgi:DNA primase large subunit
MQFAQSTSGRVSLGGASKSPVGQRKQLSLYRTPPSLEITLDEFEEFALERLSLLRGIEQMKARGFDGDELRDKINTLQNKHMPLRAKETTTASLGE